MTIQRIHQPLRFVTHCIHWQWQWGFFEYRHLAVDPLTGRHDARQFTQTKEQQR